ncbi:MAG: carotenoid 1,2-hydratase, partial [Comamonadaceae bacterium]
MTSAFDAPVPTDGYAWWYLDALSDDGRHGLTLIAFIGSVFSPYYALARRRGQGRADPHNHCAMNVALYDTANAGAPSGWCMTERGRTALRRTATRLSIGSSSLEWKGQVLTAEISERMAPWGGRMRGSIRLMPQALTNQSHALDAAGRHQWIPIAPCARVEVALEQPAVRWSGAAYMDCNRGERPLEQDFSRWTWSRASLAQGHTAVLYDVARSDRSNLSLAWCFDPAGGAAAFEPPPLAALPASGWRVPRVTRADMPPRVIQTLEDAPFYARSLISTHVLGEPATAVHESLCLRRWAWPAVQLMLP